MEQNQTTTISIIGSCVARDLFEIPKSAVATGEFKIERFVQSVNPLSLALSKGRLKNEEELLCAIENSKDHNAYKKWQRLDLTKSVFEFLGQTKSDFLILDFSAIRDDLYKIGDFYLSKALFDRLKNYCCDIQFSKWEEVLKNAKIQSALDFSNSDFESGIECFVKKILALYKKSQIIWIDARNSYLFVNSENIRYIVQKEKFFGYNQKIERAVEVAKPLLQGVHFVPLPILLANDKHKWGPHGQHYVDEIYSYLLSCVRVITSKKFSKNKEQIQLGKILEACDKNVYGIIDRTFCATEKKWQEKKPYTNDGGGGRFITFSKSKDFGAAKKRRKTFAGKAAA